MAFSRSSHLFPFTQDYGLYYGTITHFTTLGSMNKEKLPEDQIGVWIGVGIAIGAGVGIVLDNLAMGIAIGVAMGTAMAYGKKASK